jgi:hypothetical protein
MQGYPDDGVKILHEKKTKETRILERSLTVLFVNPKWFVPAMAPVEMPIGLNHLHSAFCWCDPIIDTDNSVDSIPSLCGRCANLESSWNPGTYQGEV